MRSTVFLGLYFTCISCSAQIGGRTPSLDLPEPLPGVWAPQVGSEVRPFWRKGEGPTYAPPWYRNCSAPTHEVAQKKGESDIAAGARLYTALQTLKAGDHLVIKGGTYSVDRWLSIRAQGTELKPIVISGAEGEVVTITRPNAEKNVLDIDQSKYLVLKSLRIHGGSNAIKFYTAEHVMLYDLHVAHCAGSAITANAEPTAYLSVVDCEITDTGGHGEALYLGANDGSKVTHHCAIVGNYIHDLTGPTVNQGDGIEIKQGSYANWVKYNYVRNTNYPGITLYGTGRGIDDRNVVEENIVIDSRDYAMQISADCIIRNNLVVNSLRGQDAFMSKPEPMATPGNLLIINNTFLADQTAVNCRGWNTRSAGGILFANNALYSLNGTAINGDTGAATSQGNVSLRNTSAFTDVDLSEGRYDISPKAGGQLAGAGERSFLPEVDLHGRVRARRSQDAGAVAGN